MRTDDLITFVQEVIVSLDQALKHVQHKLLVVINKDPEYSSNSEENSVPLKIAYLHLVNFVGWNTYLKD